MPLYQYQSPDGTLLDIRMPVDQRDSLPYRRVTVPQRVHVNVGASDDRQLRPVMNALRQIEEKEGLDGIRNEIGDPAEVKRIWAQPPV